MTDDLAAQLLSNTDIAASLAKSLAEFSSHSDGMGGLSSLGGTQDSGGFGSDVGMVSDSSFAGLGNGGGAPFGGGDSPMAPGLDDEYDPDDPV